MMSRHVAHAHAVPLWIGLALALASCSFRPDWNQRAWQKGDSDLALPRPSHMEAAVGGSQPLRGLTIQFEQQKLAGLGLEGSYRKNVYHGTELVWSKARHVEDRNFPSLALLGAVDRQALVTSRTENMQSLLGCRWKSEAQPVLRVRGHWRIDFQRLCEGKDGQLWRLTLNASGRILTRKPAGAAFDWTERAVSLYPRGPKTSTLERRELSVAAQPFYLFTPTLEVTSDAGFKFADINALGATTPENETFDLIQAYFYATEALRWVSEHFAFQTSGLKIRTHVGYPDKSNVAFFYNHEIRLGSGDGVTFTHIPWDASIVTHETMHEMIESLTGLPFDGEGGSLQEALADFLTAMQLNDPAMGDSAYQKAPFQRSVDNTFRVRDHNGGLYHDSLIVSGTLWELRGVIGEPGSEDLVAFLLARLVPDSDFADFGSLVRLWARTECSVECSGARGVLDRRGW